MRSVIGVRTQVVVFLKNGRIWSVMLFKVKILSDAERSSLIFVLSQRFFSIQDFLVLPVYKETSWELVGFVRNNVVLDRWPVVYRLNRIVKFLQPSVARLEVCSIIRSTKFSVSFNLFDSLDRQGKPNNLRVWCSYVFALREWHWPVFSFRSRFRLRKDSVFRHEFCSELGCSNRPSLRIFFTLLSLSGSHCFLLGLALENVNWNEDISFKKVLERSFWVNTWIRYGDFVVLLCGAVELGKELHNYRSHWTKYFLRRSFLHIVEPDSLRRFWDFSSWTLPRESSCLKFRRCSRLETVCEH